MRRSARARVPHNEVERGGLTMLHWCLVAVCADIYFRGCERRSLGGAVRDGNTPLTGSSSTWLCNLSHRSQR